MIFLYKMELEDGTAGLDCRMFPAGKHAAEQIVGARGMQKNIELWIKEPRLVEACLR